MKLLEYRSIDLEARSRKNNLLFKGISEQRRENCFAEVRRFIQEELRINKDFYLERAHRLGRFSSTKTRPIIIAFRDYYDTQEILDASSLLRGTEYGISRDYPSEISKARQSLWKQYKITREANPGKKVTFEFPARICVDGVVVRDGFPDWYPILQGSRVSCSQQTQENYATSMCSETGSVRNESSNIRPLSMGQQIDSLLRDTTDTTDLHRSQMPTQQPNSSPVHMEDDGPRSPSLFDSINASAPKEGPTEGNPNNRLAHEAEAQPVSRELVTNSGHSHRLHVAAGEQILHVAPMLVLSPEVHN